VEWREEKFLKASVMSELPNWYHFNSASVITTTTTSGLPNASTSPTPPFLWTLYFHLQCVNEDDRHEWGPHGSKRAQNTILNWYAFHPRPQAGTYIDETSQHASNSVPSTQNFAAVFRKKIIRSLRPWRWYLCAGLNVVASRANLKFHIYLWFT
jgi:hypothetical protein